MNNTVNRLTFIDVAKGLGIIAVAAGHVYTPGALHAFIFTFHMPLFFFISGYLFKPKDDKKFMQAKLQQLIVPYFSFLIVVYALQNQAAFLNDALPFWQRLALWGRALLGGRWLYGFTAAFWFAPVLFMVLLAANWLLKNCGKPLVLLLALASLAAAYANACFFSSLKIPFNANVALAALPLFLAGYFLKEERLKRYRAVGFISVTLVAAAAYVNRLPAMDMKLAVYGWPLISFAVAVAVTLAIFQFSKSIAERSRPLSAVLSNLGKASLVIMFLHQPVQILLQEHVTGNNGVRIVSALGLPYLLYLAFKTNAVCRALFLGSTEDLAKLSAGLQTSFKSAFVKAKA